MKPVTDSESSSETSETYHDDPAAVDHESVYAQNITCDAAFKFFKVGKASPSLEFTTIVRLKKDILLSELRTLLVKQHMVGVDLFKKFPAYDVHIHVHRKDKKYAAHTPQQWQEVRDLLARGFSLMVEVKGRLLEGSAPSKHPKIRNRTPVKTRTKQNAELEKRLKEVNHARDSEAFVERTPEQEQLLNEMKKRVQKKFPQALFINEMKMVCNDCKSTVLKNRIYYEDYFEKSKNNIAVLFSEASDNDETSDANSTPSVEETESDASSGIEAELDPAARLLDQEVRSGRLSQNHLFYRLVLNALKFATEIGNPINQFKHDPVVRSFCETIKRSGHWRTFNLLTGKRMLGKGRGSSHQFNWEDYNIPLPLPSNNKQGYIYESGLVRAYVISFLEMVFSSGSTIMPLLSNNKIQVVPVSLAKDGFTLKPGFQVDQNTMTILGGKDVYTLDYVKENPTLPHESFKDKFVTEAQIMGITSLDNKSALIIVNDFTGSTGDGESTMNCHAKRIQELQQCLSCLREFQDAIVKEECHTTVTAVLRTARVDSSQSKELSAVITDMALRGRDRMDTTYVAECNSKAVVDIIQRMKYLVHTLVPEMFWKEYGANKKGCLEHPISVCLGSFGSLYLVDFTAGSVVKARLHNPVDVQVLSRSMKSPTSVLYKKGVVFVAEEEAVLYLDVGNVVRLNPKVLRKPQLESELQKRGLLGPGERKPVAEMRSTLIRWLKANVPQTTRDDGFQSLFDGIRPLALTSNEERSVIFVSQRNSSTILKVTITCTGARLCGNAEPFVTLPGMACCTGLGYSEETRDLYVADSQDEGGIYM
ncbi:hypothetical protein ACROYT_G034559 [Oculina patagonica]